MHVYKVAVKGNNNASMTVMINKALDLDMRGSHSISLTQLYYCGINCHYVLIECAQLACLYALLFAQKKTLKDRLQGDGGSGRIQADGELVDTSSFGSKDTAHKDTKWVC